MKDTAVVTMIIHPAPAVSFSSTAPACIGTLVDFTNTESSGNGLQYAWDFGSDGHSGQTASQNPSGVLYSSTGIKTVTLHITNQFGCVGISTQDISINSLPSAYAGADAIVCPGSSIQLGTLSDPGNSYSWSPGAALDNPAKSDPVVTPLNPMTVYLLTVTNSLTGCKNYDTVVVKRLDQVVADAGEDADVCIDNGIKIGAEPFKGVTYHWLPVKGLSNPSIANPVATPTATITYTLTASLGSCKAVRDEVVVTVHQQPVVNAGMDQTISTGTMLQLEGSGGISCSWEPAALLNNSAIYNPVAKLQQTTLFIMTATDAYGCKASDMVNISVTPPVIWLPNAFTPNEDKLNDIFYVQGEGVESMDFRIFDRWGEQLFYSKDIHVGWDGRTQASHNELPEGTYVYTFNGTLATGKHVSLTGIVNLIR